MKIHGLSQKYWRKKIVFAIASSVGTPICVDSITSKPTLERTFGHFVRVLVDIDLTQELKYVVLVERKGYAFLVEFEYENLPKFCNFCNMIGHNIQVCRKVKKNDGGIDEKEDKKGKRKDIYKNEEVAQKVQEQNKIWVVETPAVIDLDPGASHANLQQVENIERNSGPQNVEVAEAVVDKSQRKETIADKEAYQNVEVAVVDDDNSQRRNSSQNSKTMAGQNSQDTEFVDDTFQHTEGQGSSQNQIIPIQIQQDMQFIHDSWANLVDADVEVIKHQEEVLAARLAREAAIDGQIQNEVQVNIDSSGFQVVTSSASKKEKKTRRLGSQGSQFLPD